MTMRWYVVHTYSGFEKSVQKSLAEHIKRAGMEDKFGEIMVPTEEVVEMKSGQKRTSERKFFPGYVLVRMEMSDETWHLHGYPNAVVTSNYIAEPDVEQCSGSGNCSRDCPIEAIDRVADEQPRFRKFGRPAVKRDLCIGCGVCTLRCKASAMKLHKREQRVLHPETTFERVILQCLERGTLQNQLFDNPASLTHAFARACLGGFLRLPPVKRALMSEALRSRFLGALKHAALKRGQGRLVEA